MLKELDRNWEIWTAIANAESESYVVRLLFDAQMATTQRHFTLSSCASELSATPAPVVVILSSDLPDFDQVRSEKLQSSRVRILLLDRSEIDGNSSTRILPTELLRRVRELFKSYDARIESRQFIPNPQCQIIGLTSHSGGVGTTQIAINVAMELSLLGKQTLLLDGDSSYPAIAELLQIRNFSESINTHTLKENLKFLEIAQISKDGMVAHLQPSADSFEFIITDLGRYNTQAPTYLQEWGLDFAARIFFISSYSRIHQSRTRDLLDEVKQRGTSGSIHEIRNFATGKMRAGDLPKDERLFLEIVKRGVMAVEVNPRSKWRKGIAQIAAHLIS
jgi:hypothetical protein